MASPGDRLNAEERNSSAREQLSGSQAESPYTAAYERLRAAFRTATARVEPGEVVKFALQPCVTCQCVLSVKSLLTTKTCPTATGGAA
jgi:hypothetical protein